MRICAVVGCGKSTYHLEQWRSENCEKHGTRNGLHHCDCPPPFTLFSFPTEKKDPEGRLRWNNLMNRTDLDTGQKWEAKSHHKVCTSHFPDGKPTQAYPDPVLNLGYTLPCEQEIEKVTPKCQPPTRRFPLEKKQRVEEPEEPMTPIEKIEQDHRYTYKCECCIDCNCPGCISKQVQINKLEHRVKELEQKLIADKTKKRTATNKGKKQAFGADTLRTDSEFNHCTGLRSKQAFKDTYTYLEPYAKKMTYWKSSSSKSVPTLPITLIPASDDILKVCAALVNLQPDLIK